MPVVGRTNLAGIIAFVGACLLVYQWALARPLWLDEQMIALNLRERSLASLAGPLWLGQSAPFGWLALQRAVLLLLGTGERALRLVPLLFGLGTLVSAVWVGRRWMGPVGATGLVLLCSLGQWISLYVVELKHYSADTFWALCLPALCAWAAESPDDSRVRSRRVLLWWTAAALCQWVSNGALLVTPACALVVFGVLAQRAGWRVSVSLARWSLIWAASFGLYYLVSLRHTLASEYLNAYWAFALPPISGGWHATWHWLLEQFEPLAGKPGGTEWWIIFWIAAVAGFALLARTTRRRALGLAMAAIPLFAFGFAAIRLVPLYERLSLWVVPALYVGIAFSCDSSVRRARAALARANWTRLCLNVVLGAAAFLAVADICSRGAGDLRYRPGTSNHQLDDRATVRWLLTRYRPGDVVVTTRLSLPALWWYGGTAFPLPGTGGTGEQERGSMLEVHYASTGPECEGVTGLQEALKDRTRAIVYLGFRFDDVPRGFDDLLLAYVAAMGSMTAAARFGELSFAAVFDLDTTSAGRTPVVPDLRSRNVPVQLTGCPAVKPAARW